VHVFIPLRCDDILIYLLTGILAPYYPRSSEADDSNLISDESGPTPTEVHADETQPLIQPRDEQPPDHPSSSTRPQGDVGEVEVNSEGTTEREEIQDVMVANTGPRISFPAMRVRQLSPAPLKQEDDEFPHSTMDSFPSKWLAELGDKRHQTAREGANSHAFDSVHSPTRCQTLIACIRDAEVSSKTSYDLLHAQRRTDAG
jgi:hypothetical protein